MKTYKDIYKLPLRDIGYGAGRVNDANGNFVFQFLFDNEEKRELLLAVINGVKNLENKELKFRYEDDTIKDNIGNSAILIRGWGT